MVVNPLSLLPSVITTKRTSIQKSILKDAAELYPIWSSKNVAQFMNIGQFTSIYQAKEMLITIMDEEFACRYTIRSAGKVIGSIGINEVNLVTNVAEIGYEIAEKYWRQGIMTEVLTAFLAAIKTSLQFTGVTAKVLPANIASMFLLQKLAFKPTERIQEYDLFSKQLCNVIIYYLSLLDS